LKKGSSGFLKTGQER